MKVVLDVNARVVRIKKIIDPVVVTMYLLQKKVHEEILVLVCT
jgi:hypothetical protein